MSQAFSAYFSAFIQDENIMCQTIEGTQQVGVLQRKYDDLLGKHKNLTETATQYRDRLIELGEITVPMTQEQIIQQQAEQIKQTNDLLAESHRIQKELLEKIQAIGGLNQNEHMAKSIERNGSGTPEKSDSSGNRSVSDFQKIQGNGGRDSKSAARNTDKPSAYPTSPPAS